MKISIFYARGAYIFFLCCSIMTVMLFCGRLVRPFFVYHTYICEAQSVSSDCLSRIQEALMSSAGQNFVEIMRQLQELFPAIDDVSLLFYPHQVSAVITTHEPLCLINNEKILIANRALVDKNFFNNAAIAALPSFFISAESLPDVLDHVPQALFCLGKYHSHFNAELVHKNCLYLQDKDEAQFVVVSMVDRYFSKKVSDCCQQIKQQLSSRGAFKKNIRWLADIRFADHIIVYRG